MISVIMPVYNVEKYLAKSIQSILGQSIKDWELIIINDGSNDQSERIIQSFTDPRIRYFKQENRGTAAARNRALDLAQGEWITFQDADDLSVPARFATLARHFYSSNIGLVYSDVLLINEADLPIGYIHCRAIERQHALRYFFKNGSPCCGGSVMARREVFQQLRYDTSLEIGNDNDILLRIMRQWEAIYLPEPLYLYRRHGGNNHRRLDYQTQFSHLHKLLKEFSLAELIPELDWERGDHQSNQVRATALAALFIWRRGMELDARNWLSQARSLKCSPDDSRLVKAIHCLMVKNYPGAIQLLKEAARKDHIIENYLGECHAFLGDRDQAAQCFKKALDLAPEYPEPLENLRALGMESGFIMEDKSWLKFRPRQGGAIN